MSRDYEQGIYEIVCMPTGRSYIGSSRRISTRWEEHRKALEAGGHFNLRLQRAWSKYGASAFIFRRVEEVEDRDALLVRETFLLRLKRPAFNINLEGQGGPIRLGRRNSAAQNAKIAAAHRGLSPSLESREKMRRAKLGRVPWNKGRQLPSSWNKGRAWTEEERARLRAAHVGKTLPAEQRRRIGESLRRYHASATAATKQHPTEGEIDRDPKAEAIVPARQRAMEKSDGEA